MTRAPVAARIAAFCDRCERDRLSLYREFLQVAVASASPLVGTVASSLSLDLEALLQGLRPPRGWPERDLRSLVGGRSSIRRGHPRREGHVVARDYGHPCGPVVFSAAGRSLEVGFRIGGTIVCSSEGVLLVRIDQMLPDSAAAAAIGRPLSDLVAHRWFDDGWTISKVRGAGAGMWIHVPVGEVPFVMPWPGLVASRSVEGLPAR